MLWTYEAGDAIESSAAIADGVVYVGSQTGRAARDRTSPTASRKWKYKASDDRHRRILARSRRGLVYIGDLSRRRCTPSTRPRGKAAWTFKTGTEIKSSPVVAGDRVLIGSYDSHLYALGAKDGKLLWKMQTEGYVHATPAVVDGIAYIAGCDEILRGDPHQRRQGGTSTLSSGAYTGASPADRRRQGLLRHL